MKTKSEYIFKVDPELGREHLCSVEELTTTLDVVGLGIDLVIFREPEDLDPDETLIIPRELVA